MTGLTRRSLLRGSVGFAATAAVTRSYIANAALLFGPTLPIY
jgi:hypothetical protein